MNYGPRIRDGRPVERFENAGFRAVLLTDVVAAGAIDYAHVLLVTASGSDQPVCAVAAEVSRPVPGLNSPSHVLGLFPGDGHVHLDAADEWAQLEAFRARSLEVAAEHLGLENSWRSTHVRE